MKWPRSKLNVQNNYITIPVRTRSSESRHAPFTTTKTPIFLKRGGREARNEPPSSVDHGGPDWRPVEERFLCFGPSKWDEGSDRTLVGVALSALSTSRHPNAVVLSTTDCGGAGRGNNTGGRRVGRWWKEEEWSGISGSGRGGGRKGAGGLRRRSRPGPTLARRRPGRPWDVDRVQWSLRHFRACTSTSWHDARHLIRI
jgi:hypothetical protein